MPTSRVTLAFITLAASLALSGCARRTAGPLVIRVDANANRHAISPLIYGVAFATAAQVRDLRAPINRSGGNARTRYNWKLNASNHASDWFFESLPESGGRAPGAMEDAFVSSSREGGAAAMLTVPTIGWVAKLGPHGEKLASFSVAKYGAQQKADIRGMSDAGNGVRTDGSLVVGNDPNDAHVPSTPDFQREWVRHLVKRFGSASKGGVSTYLMDNEPGLWHVTHRDVHPVGATMDEVLFKLIAYGSVVRAVDPTAMVAGPEEWSYIGALQSGYDNQRQSQSFWKRRRDRLRHWGWDYVPWLLDQMRRNEAETHRRVLDVVTLHYYPQGGEFGNDVSPDMQLRRNRSTRSLWDSDYTDETWVKDKIQLIPRMKEWVAKYYPGTKTGITEYNWGAEATMNGATAQADVLGIFGREGLDVANRWITPATGTPTYNAIKMYRNYDGKGGVFGDVCVADSAPDCDKVASFAAMRSSDGALTVMVINKQLSGSASFTLDLKGAATARVARVWQLSGGKPIRRGGDVAVNGNAISTTVPAQSVTLYVFGGRADAEPALRH